MKIFLILVIMLFCHTLYDFHIQGILAQMKQKDWSGWDLWKGNGKNEKYTNDYKMALAVHSFEWAFCIQLPILASIYNRCGKFGWFDVKRTLLFVCLIVLNSIIHYIIDDMKANGKSINLVQDQTIHIFQVVTTWVTWLVSFGF